MKQTFNWYFGPGGAEDKGPKDSIEFLFRGNKYYSIAREAIQNSLDAVLDKDKPVTVSFSLLEIKKAEMQPFFLLQKNIEKCLEYYSTDAYAKKILNDALSVIKDDKIKCLKISDFNTTGMSNEGEKSNFYAFMQAVGVNLKSSQGSGGSFGFGKGAYYAASRIKSILVSSIYGKNKFIFQGKSRLTTHKLNGQKKDYVGIYGVNKGEPVIKREGIPAKLRRTETGTDIIVMGFHEEPEWKESLIKSVLNNFWLSIIEGCLIVKIEDVEINKNNLEATVAKYYKASQIDGSVSEPENWTPYPYLLAYKSKGKSDTKYFENALPTIGKVRLYLLLREGLPNRIEYMRGPKMTVFKKTDNRGYNYAGVFVCDDQRGNEILKEMENPQHNEWKKTNYLDGDKPHPDSIKADAELKKFISSCLQEIFQNNVDTAQKVYGLDRWINIPEDLLPEEEGEGGKSDRGIASDEIIKTENAEEVTKKGDETKTTLAISKKAAVLNKQTGDKTNGDELTFVLNDAGGREGGNDDDDSEETPQLGNSEQGEKKIKVPLPIRYRVIAQKKEDNVFEHILKIFAPKDANVDIEVHAGVDSDGETDDTLTITKATNDSVNFKFEKNKLIDIPLKKGENVIKTIFDTNQKHSLKLSSYEI